MPRPGWSRRGSPAAHEARDSRARRPYSGRCVRSGRAREDAGFRGRGGSAGSRRALERRSSGRRRSGCHSRRSSASPARRSPTLARGAPRGDARAAAGPARSSGVSLESPQPFLGHGGGEMDWPHGTRGRTKRLLLRMRSSIAVLWSTSRIYSAEQILQKYGPNPAAIIAVATQWEGATTKSLILHSWTDLDFRSPSCQEDPRVLDMAGHSDRRTHALNRPCAIREASHGDEPAGGAEDARGRGGSGVRPRPRQRPEW